MGQVAVKVRCVFCKKTKNVGPNEKHIAGVPMCECGGVMVAIQATAVFERPSSSKSSKRKQKR